MKDLNRQTVGNCIQSDINLSHNYYYYRNRTQGTYTSNIKILQTRLKQTMITHYTKTEKIKEQKLLFSTHRLYNGLIIS